MTPEILLDRLHAHGVQIVPAPGGHLRLIAARRPPDELMEAARQLKPALLRMLSTPEARSAGAIVFDVAKTFGPGLRIIAGGLAGLDAPARPRAVGRTRRRSPRLRESGGPIDAA